MLGSSLGKSWKLLFCGFVEFFSSVSRYNDAEWVLSAVNLFGFICSFSHYSSLKKLILNWMKHTTTTRSYELQSEKLRSIQTKCSSRSSWSSLINREDKSHPRKRGHVCRLRKEKKTRILMCVTVKFFLLLTMFIVKTVGVEVVEYYCMAVKSTIPCYRHYDLGSDCELS